MASSVMAEVTLVAQAGVVVVAWVARDSMTRVTWSWVARMSRVSHGAVGEGLGHRAGLVSTAALHAACVKDLSQLHTEDEYRGKRLGESKQIQTVLG